MRDKFDATGDKRVSNNAVRHQYRTLTDTEKAQMQAIKDIGQQLLDQCDEIGSSRELSLAKTNIEQAVMWACKHVTS